jgi:hypothetical protein
MFTAVSTVPDSEAMIARRSAAAATARGDARIGLLRDQGIQHVVPPSVFTRL